MYEVCNVKVRFKLNCSASVYFHAPSLLRRGLFVLWGGLCCGEAGEKEKESARGTMGRGKREDILMGIPSGSLCGGESHAPESERVARVSMFDTHASSDSVCLSSHFVCLA